MVLFTSFHQYESAYGLLKNWNEKNALMLCSHLNGFAPVYKCIFISKQLDCENPVLHWCHLYGFSPVAICKWLDKEFNSEKKLYLHWSHYGFFCQYKYAHIFIKCQNTKLLYSTVYTDYTYLALLQYECACVLISRRLTILCCKDCNCMSLVQYMYTWVMIIKRFHKMHCCIDNTYMFFYNLLWNWLLSSTFILFMINNSFCWITMCVRFIYFN